MWFLENILSGKINLVSDLKGLSLQIYAFVLLNQIWQNSTDFVLSQYESISL